MRLHHSYFWKPRNTPEKTEREKVKNNNSTRTSRPKSFFWLKQSVAKTSTALRWDSVLPTLITPASQEGRVSPGCGRGRKAFSLPGKRAQPTGLPPTPQEGDSRLTSADGIPGEGHTCMRSGVMGLAQVTPFGPVASSRRKARHARGAHGGSPFVVQLHEESGDSTGDHEATAGQRTVSENEVLPLAAEGAGTRNKTPRHRLHATPKKAFKRVQVRACSK